MSDDFDANRWLNGPPDDPDDHSRRVHLERMITARKRRQWLWSLAKLAPVGAGIVLILWQAALLVAERFPAP